MTVTTSGLHTAGGLICVHVNGATGSTAELIVDGQGSSVRLLIPLTNGKGTLCFHPPPGFGRFLEMEIRDTTNVPSFTGSVRI